MSALARALVLALLLLTPACGVALVVAGGAVGVWAYDENAEDGGTIVLPYTADQVLRVAEGVARERGGEVEVFRGSRRIECVIEDINVKFHVLEVAGNDEVCELKVRARTLWRGRADLAEDLAITVQDRLG